MSTSFDEKWTRKKIKRCRQRENLFSATTPHYIRMKHCGLQFFLSVLSSLFVKNDEVEENFNASLIPGFSSFSWCVFFFQNQLHGFLWYSSAYLPRRRWRCALRPRRSYEKWCTFEVWFSHIMCVPYAIVLLRLLFSRAEWFSFFFFF